MIISNSGFNTSWTSRYENVSGNGSFLSFKHERRHNSEGFASMLNCESVKFLVIVTCSFCIQAKTTSFLALPNDSTRIGNIWGPLVKLNEELALSQKNFWLLNDHENWQAKLGPSPDVQAHVLFIIILSCMRFMISEYNWKS